VKILVLAFMVCSVFILGETAEAEEFAWQTAAIPTSDSIEEWLKELKVAEMEPFAGGIIARGGHGRVFVGRRANFPQLRHLYPVVVRMLSEKFSCFITEKTGQHEEVLFKCRDGRRVAVWRSENLQYVAMLARQFDAQGYEIIVDNHQVVRVSSEPILKIAH
jgi:hypothetical protein